MGSVCTKRPVTIKQKKKDISDFVKTGNFNNKYEFISNLGCGMFGKVDLYKDKTCNFLYAIKTLLKQDIPSYMLNFIIREVQILTELDHPNIVKYYETYDDGKFLKIVMEHIQGDDLEKLFISKNYKIEENEISHIFKYLLKALNFIHKKGIIHRDIKPQNILFSNRDDYRSLKLVDYGLSVYSNDNDNMRVGSPLFMAPETVNGKYSEKSDMWSVGVLLFFFITNKFPYHAESRNEMFEKLQSMTYNKEILKCAQYSYELKVLIDNLLSKNEIDRLSANQVLESAWIKKWETDYKSISIDVFNNFKKFKQKNLFQKEILYYIAKIMNDTELYSLRRDFEELDKDNTGTLEKEEILLAFDNMEIKVDKKDIDLIWDEMDFHKDGNVNYTEFLAATMPLKSIIDDQKIYAAFKYFDGDNNGYITVDSVLKRLKLNNFSQKENDIKLIIREFSSNKSNSLNFDDFKSMLRFDI